MEEDSISEELREVISQGQEGGGEEKGGEKNYGFKPLEEDKPKESEEDKNAKRKREENESVEGVYWKQKIARLIARYPGLIPRTSSELVNALNQYGVEELKNIHQNCISDVVKYRGTPSAEVVLTCLTHHMNKTLPQFQKRCMEDIELRRDIEEEVISFLGFFDSKINILFRLFNNLYKAIMDTQPYALFHMVNDYNTAADPLTTNINTQNETEDGREEYIRAVPIGTGTREENENPSNGAFPTVINKQFRTGK